MAIHPEVLELTNQQRTGRRRLSNEVVRRTGFAGVVLRTGLALLGIGLVLLFASTLTLLGNSAISLVLFGAAAVAVVAGSILTATTDG